MALAAQDLRLAAIAERLLVANAHLCRSQMLVAGMILHSADQYSDDARPEGFAESPVGIAQVVTGGAADNAGIPSGAALLAIGDTPVAEIAKPEDGPLRDAVFDVVAAQPLDAPLQVTYMHGGQFDTRQIIAPTGCLALYEITTEKTLSARSDGRVIQITYPLAALASDNQLAAVFAHELAHSVLEHRRRLSAAGVSKGFFGEFGRNQRYNRQVEVEADRMMVHLLANAGYDPAIASAFFRSDEGQRITGGLLSFVYPTPTSRAELIEREIAMFLPLGTSATWPGHLLALRDQAFGED